MVSKVIGYTEYYSHGCDKFGQLGHAQEKKQGRIEKICSPKSLSFDILIASVSCGSRHTLILSHKGEVFSIGCNSYGQLGLNDR